MNNNAKISNLQFSTLIIFPILSLFSGIGLYDLIKVAEIDAYISAVVAAVLGFIIVFVFLSIFNYKKDLSLPEKNKELFGKFLGTLINYIISGLMVIVGVCLIYSISNFIVSQFLSKTPIWIVLALLGLVILYNVTKGIEIIARTGIIFIILIICLTIISTFGLIPLFDTANIKPFLVNGIDEPLKGGMLLTLTNIVPIFVLLIIPRNNIIDNKKISRNIFIAYIIAMLFVFNSTILTVGVLGIHLAKIFPHPEYIVLKKISILGFVQRIENFIYIKWLLNDFISFGLIVYFISNNIRKKNKQKIVPILVIALILILSQVLFKDNTQFKWFVLHIYPYLNLLLLLIFLIIFINVIIRKFIEKET